MRAKAMPGYTGEGLGHQPAPALLQVLGARLERDHKASSVLKQAVYTLPVRPASAGIGLEGESLRALLPDAAKQGRYAEKYRQALAVILYGALSLACRGAESPPGRYVLALPRRAQGFANPIDRYRENNIGLKPWCTVVDGLCRKGLLALVLKGMKSPNRSEGMTSLYEPTEALNRWLNVNASDLSLAALAPVRELVRLDRTEETQQGGKEPVDYEDNEITRTYRTQLEQVNAVNRQHRFEWFNRERSQWLEVPPLYVDARRIFRDNFRSGGRVYSALQSMPGQERKALRINGAETVELDYSSHQPRILYHINSLEAPHDCYAHPEIDRDLMKAAMVRVMNCGSEAKARAALAKLLRDQAEAGGTPGLTARPLLQAVWKSHPLLRQSLHADLWKRLHFAESEVTVAILSRFAAMGKPCLGVHDSFVVMARDRDYLHAAMVEEYRERMNGFEPVIKQS